MKRMLMVVALAACLTAACTDAEKSAWGALGDEATITCYSGGDVIFTDHSTGKVVGGESGVYFKSKTTGKFIKTYADCVIISN